MEKRTKNVVKLSQNKTKDKRQRRKFRLKKDKIILQNNSEKPLLSAFNAQLIELAEQCETLPI